MISLITIAFITTLSLSLALTPAVKKIAWKIGAVDIPNNRKVHSRPTTRLGGVAVAASLFAGLLLIAFLKPDLFLLIISESDAALMSYHQSLFILASLLLVLSIGIWDDVRTLGPGFKFLIQLAAASLIYFAGFQISTVANPFGTGTAELSMFSYPVTVIWIIGVTNAFNLIDGLDGLASGVAVISLVTIAAIAYVQGQSGITLASILLAGSILGFLWYNFRPATIFLGDSGSLLLGFALSLLSIESYTKLPTTFSVLVPIFVLGLPIIDTLLSMIRRFFSWFLPGKEHGEKNPSLRRILYSIFQPDKSHIHHRLISHGFSHRNTVLVLYLVSICFGISAFIVAVSGHTSTTIFLVLTLLFFIKIGVGKLRYSEIDLLHNGVFYGLYNSLVINKRHFRKVLDGLFVLSAFAGAAYIVIPDPLITRITGNWIDAATFWGPLLVIQMGSFGISGVYKETIRQLGIADVFTIIKSILIGCILAGAVHYFFLQPLLPFSFLLYILDFYFLTTLILGIRVSFHLLRHLFYKSRTDNRRVLIYGAGEKGLLALNFMLAFNSNRYTPVGFLDENPEMEGRVLNGFPVFGGHWKLKQMVKKKRIDELHITDPGLNDEILKRIRKIALETNLQIQFLDVSLKNMSLHPTVRKPTVTH